MSSDPDHTLARLATARLVPIVVIDDARDAVPVAEALAAGGIGCAEVTLRTASALRSIAAMTSVDDFLVGAGTVLEPGQVDESTDAGAEFVVSPGLDPDIVARCRRRGVLPLPGVATASEVQHAVRLGLTAVKFFPADRLGGLATITAFAGPFPAMQFMPSGGISVDNVVDYLAHPAVVCVGGSWMVPRSLIAARDFAAITRLAAQATSLIESATTTEPAGVPAR